MGYLSNARKDLHATLLQDVIREANGTPNFADKGSKSSKAIAYGIIDRLEGEMGNGEIDGQTAGKLFEVAVSTFVNDCLHRLQHVRPGRWMTARQKEIWDFQQYAHLRDIERAKVAHPELNSVFGSDYLVKPDIVVYRYLDAQAELNALEELITDDSAKHACFRNAELPLLHASISCKWTLRSDRAQNARTEALNLIRNRKGRAPHIVVVTAEPTPNRIASIAQGTGDVDRVYHFALYELLDTLKHLAVEQPQSYANSYALLNLLVEGKRLRDISDLPLDLAL